MKEPKKTRTREQRRLVPINLDKIRQRFLIALKREANHILDESFENKLSEESAKTLVNYLKLLNDLKQIEEEDLEKLTDEELEQKLGKTIKQGERDAWR